MRINLIDDPIEKIKFDFKIYGKSILLIKVFNIEKIEDLINKENLIQNFRGAHFLDSLIKRYKGRVDIALSHYNGGSAVGVWPKVKIIPVTYSYVVKVLKKSSKFKKYNQDVIINVKPQNIVFDPYKELNNNLDSVDQWLKIFDDYKKFYN
mgnify:CR=1 FL=1